MRGAMVLAASAGYLAFVYRLDDEQSRVLGLGDWIDPYCINGLLEHWFHVARTLANPASPPMFHPAPHVLGYSHGLILFAPFYVPLRLWLHPFHAYTGAIFAVMMVGVACLYVLMRRGGRSFVECVGLCALFFSSPNVMNGMTGVWTQRASVFLLPPVLLLATRSVDGRGWRGAVPVFTAGLLASLMYVQDFYTAHLSMLLVVWFGAAVVMVEHRGTAGAFAGAFVRPPSRAARRAFGIALVGAAAAALILVSGGADVRVAGIRLVARDWRRPAVVALLAAAFVIARDPRLVSMLRRAGSGAWLRVFAAGAAVGAGVFLWIYLPAFREHSGFAAAEVHRALA
jgi:hypothetical protein